MERNMRVFMLVGVVMVATLVGQTMGTIQDDEKDCADQLTNLAACIPYVSGTAKMPTKQCCEDTKKVKEDKPKCLCVLIKESADPSMGLPVNTTLALQMPGACKIDGKASDCIALLKLAPDSPDAKLFKDTSASADSTTSPATSTTTPSSDSASGGSGSSSTSGSSSDSASGSKATPTSSSGVMSKMVERGSLFGLIASVAWILLA